MCFCSFQNKLVSKKIILILIIHYSKIMQMHANMRNEIKSETNIWLLKMAKLFAL